MHLEDYFMTQKEVDRALILAKVKEKQLTLKGAAHAMLLSHPQTKRLWSRYKKEGPKGLISRKRGVKSNRAVSDEERKKIATIISENYRDCKPLFITEKLCQHHNINYSSEFIRQLMIEYHLWFPKRSKAKTHPRRQRKESEGMLLQGDASDHDWFEGRGPRCHLHLFVDDATSKIEGGWFDLEETTEGYYRALKPVLKQKGRPVNLYTDKRGTFVVNQGSKKGKTQFARAMKELNINMITAHSPQAKGRIERAIGTLQERLVWEMRINDVCTIEEANSFLPKFFEEYNNKYAKEPSSPFDAYRPLNKNISLKHILSKKEERTVSKNLEVQYKNQIYQLTASDGMRMQRQKITVITTLDHELIFEYQGHVLNYVCYREIECKKPEICLNKLMDNWKDKQRKNTKPFKYHPWEKSRFSGVALSSLMNKEHLATFPFLSTLGFLYTLLSHMSRFPIGSLRST